jgi:hypothetical protein
MPAVCHYCEEDAINEAWCEKFCRLCVSGSAVRQESYSVLGDTKVYKSTCLIFMVVLWAYYVGEEIGEGQKDRYPTAVFRQVPTEHTI